MTNQKSKNKDIINFINGYSKNEYTFLALKPDSVNLIAIKVVIDVLKKNGLNIVFHAPANYTQENVREHYKEIYEGYKRNPEGKYKFYPELEEYLTSGPIYGLIIEGRGCVKKVKELCGDTSNPAKNTMRAKLFEEYGIPYDKNKNGIHASGEVPEAMREISNFLIAARESDLKTICQDLDVKDVARYIKWNSIVEEEKEFNQEDNVN